MTYVSRVVQDKLHTIFDETLRPLIFDKGLDSEIIFKNFDILTDSVRMETLGYL